MISTVSRVEVLCANCNSTGMSVFYDIKQVPVHSVLLHSSRQEAVEFPKGDITLAYCPACGFISNISFDPTRQNYLTHNYDATQAFSDTFNAFHRSLALHLIDQYDLHGKRVIEIGCGQGEFLDLLCDLGENIGVGFDPAYVEGKWIGPAHDRITFIKDFYTEENARQYRADLVCCKMTLEHIHETHKFVSMVSRSVRNQPGTIVFFQVPNAQHVFHEVAFWDIYYEHCSYFSRDSLTYLFQLCGFEVINTSVDYDNQYLMIEARPAQSTDQSIRFPPAGLSELENEIQAFQTKHVQVIAGWQDRIRRLFAEGKKVVVWGGSSKAVGFLTTLKVQDEIEYVIDINPNKHGMYLAGTGQKIVSHEFLKSYQPDLVIVMNPIYTDEIRDLLAGIGVTCDLISIQG